MKVLLLSEFSSLHRYIKEGLQELGVDVTLAADGDRWKKIPGADRRLRPDRGRGPGYYREILRTVDSFRGYDVVQMVTSRLYPFPLDILPLRRLARQNRCLSLVSGGGDYALVQAYLDHAFEYYVCDYDKSYLKLYDPNTVAGRRHTKVFETAARLADVIVPIEYEYAVGYKNNPKLAPVIPFGINTKEVPYTPNTLRDGKVVFFHGLNDEAKKGTPFIRAALERLKENYPHDVEVIIDGHMPFETYLEVLGRTNVLLDQCCGYGYGLNAGLSMAKGKVCMAPCRPEAMAALGVTECPVLHIQPDAGQIYRQLVHVLENKDKLEQWGYESRRYIESRHDYIQIAQSYLDAWRATGKV